MCKKSLKEKNSSENYPNTKHFSCSCYVTTRDCQIQPNQLDYTRFSVTPSVVLSQEIPLLDSQLPVVLVTQPHSQQQRGNMQTAGSEINNKTLTFN